MGWERDSIDWGATGSALCYRACACTYGSGSIPLRLSSLVTRTGSDPKCNGATLRTRFCLIEVLTRRWTIRVHRRGYTNAKRGKFEGISRQVITSRDGILSAYLRDLRKGLSGAVYTSLSGEEDPPHRVKRLRESRTQQLNCQRVVHSRNPDL